MMKLWLEGLDDSPTYRTSKFPDPYQPIEALWSEIEGNVKSQQYKISFANTSTQKRIEVLLIQVVNIEIRRNLPDVDFLLESLQ